MSRKERPFQEITREIRNFSEKIISESFFVSNNFASVGMRNMRINSGMLQNAGKNSKTQPKKWKMRNVRTVNARKNGKSGRSGRAALSGVTLGDVDYYTKD